MMTNTQLSRRGFIGASGGAIVGAAMVPAALQAAEVPVLHADGIHDDTDALEALFAGRQVRVAQKDVVARYENGTVRLINGRYLMSRPVRAHGDAAVYTGHCTFRIGEGPALPYPELQQFA
ncbi:hypothetical protein M2337_001514 [Sphingobium sp. B2D3A]|uniref:twin-arginine translocation signal domain-containing protein n=1 Tax=unclassified Sphingobium TaxID=2611147 RepID=UPI0022243138|nr:MULTISPECIES: twin-arginine translocation signal domain-containing protein [unclassified Sphingobium]MCW2337281.1 hypothetical protein [Sphingobium sp. B2D3A]